MAILGDNFQDIDNVFYQNTTQKFSIDQIVGMNRGNMI